MSSKRTAWIQEVYSMPVAWTGRDMGRIRHAGGMKFYTCIAAAATAGAAAAAPLALPVVDG